MMRAIIDAIRELSANAVVRVIVLKAEGKVFSAGHDLKEIAAGGEAESRAIFDLCNDLMACIRDAPQPVIAQVDGLATAAGCQVVAACDLAVCSEESRFATPGGRVGIFCTTPGVAVSRAVQPKKAMEMLLTGTPISAADAERSGLVNRVVPAAMLDETVRALAEQIAEYSPAIISLGKQAFYRQLDMGCGDAYRYAADVMVENTQLPDAKEGMAAFIEKRAPRWGA
jgi:enoyl-CoA hydratase/carnithine racemase